VTSASTVMPANHVGRRAEQPRPERPALREICSRFRQASRKVRDTTSSAAARAGATFVNGKLAERPGEDAPPQAA